MMNKIKTTHVGSLPRPPHIFALLEEKERTGQKPEGFDAAIEQAVHDIVTRQVESGIDIVGDGEVSKFSYTFYLRHRLEGIGVLDETKERPKTAAHRDLVEHPAFLERIQKKTKGVNWYEMVPPPCCDGPVAYKNHADLIEDMKNLKSAITPHKNRTGFVSAASPGVLTKFIPDQHYNNEDDYMAALAKAMQVEYEAVNDAGFIVQVDSPDLGSARHNQYQDLSDDEFVKVAQRNIDILNYATRNIPPENMRMHVCWGNYEGPHTHDIAFTKIAPAVFSARPQTILFEGANPRHAHEWEDLLNIDIPEDKRLCPGVIDTTTNFVEHPKLVAQRIMNFAKVVGRDRVMAGTDCGFATFAGPNNPIVPSVVWAKLKSLSDGAEIATERLWARS